jgi:hypothetical protein
MVVQQRIGEAEEQYLTQLTESRRLEVQDGAVSVARELANKPGQKLSRRAAQRALVRYTDGALTAGEYLTLMQQRPAQQRHRSRRRTTSSCASGCGCWPATRS